VLNHSENGWSSSIHYPLFERSGTQHIAMEFTPFCLLYRLHPRTPFYFPTQDCLIGLPGEYKLNVHNARQFAEEQIFVRLAAKNVLGLAQLRFHEYYNEGHIFVLYEPSDMAFINIYSLRLPKSNRTEARFTR
jgi:hypothetical protein